MSTPQTTHSEMPTINNGCGAPIEVSPETFVESSEGYPVRAFIGPHSSRGWIPHWEVYSDGSSYRVLKVWRTDIGGEVATSVWLPYSDLRGKKHASVLDASALIHDVYEVADTEDPESESTEAHDQNMSLGDF